MSDKELIVENARWILKMQHGMLTPHMRETFTALTVALEARQVDEAKAWNEGWSARASRRYAHLKVGESVPAPNHINPYRLGEHHEPEPTDDDLALDEFELVEPERKCPFNHATLTECEACGWVCGLFKPEPVAPQPSESDPNKYAGFVARQNHQRDRWRGIGAKCLCGKVFDLDADHAMHQTIEILKAARTAAPAETEYEYGVKWEDSEEPVWYDPFDLGSATRAVNRFQGRIGGFVVRKPKPVWEPLPVPGGEGENDAPRT